MIQADAIRYIKGDGGDLMRKFSKHLFDAAIRETLANKIDGPIPRSGKAGKNVMGYVTFIVLDNGAHVLVKGHTERYIYGVMQNANTGFKSVAIRLKKNKLSYQSLKVQHFIGLAEVEYFGLWDYILGDWTGIYRLYFKFHALLNYVLNFKTYKRKSRYEVLNFLTENYGLKKDFSIRILIKRLYPSYLNSDATYSHMHNKVLELVEAFITSGEIKQSILGYRLTPKAFITLDQYEIDDQRYHQQLWFQKLIALATIVSAIVAALAFFSPKK